MCWLLSNIAAGTEAQIDQLISSGYPYVRSLVRLATDSPYEIRKEATWAICNFVTTGTEKHVKWIADRYNVTATLALGLGRLSKENKLIKALLEALDVIFNIGLRDSLGYRVRFDEADGLDVLEKLQDHPDEEIYHKSVYLIETYFDAEEAEDSQIASNENENVFSFGLPSKQLFPDPRSSNSTTSAPKSSFNFGSTASFNATGMR